MPGTGDRLAASLQAAQQMLAACSHTSDTTSTRKQAPELSANSQIGNSSRKCKSVQFGLVPHDFRRLRRISNQLGWSRAELARRSLLLVMEFLEDQYSELLQGAGEEAQECLNPEQLSLWPALTGRGKDSPGNAPEHS